MTTKIPLSILLVAVGVIAGASCQTYDFEPAQPLAVSQTVQKTIAYGRYAKPNLMLLVDKSGSMDLPILSQTSTCPNGCGTTKGNLCPVGGSCQTRWSSLESAMQTFLSQHGTVARMGLSLFPAYTGSGTSCNPTDSVKVDISQSDDVDTELQSWANGILTALQNVQSHNAAEGPSQGNETGGGTPTSSSIEFLGTWPTLNQNDKRDDFILLLTDGLPNCNPSNQYDCAVDTVACQATAACCTGCVESVRRQICLDRNQTVNTIATLRATRNIRTIVVGFGEETSTGVAGPVLEAMAQAGGFVRTCPNGTDAECGTGTCDTATKTCSPSYFQAGDAAGLADALSRIAANLATDPCLYVLSQAPSDPRFLSVLINGAPITAGPDTWSFTAPQTVKLTGDLCQRVTSATPANPVTVEIRIIQAL